MKPSTLFTHLFILLFAFVQISPAFAGIVTTDRSFNQQVLEQERDTLRDLMSRAEVRAVLERNGLTVLQAQQRVDALTDAEVHQMAAQFEELPAAGSTAVAILIITLAVLVLELAGLTDIFTAI